MIPTPDLSTDDSAPYWASYAEDLPAGLHAPAAAFPDVPDCPWLVFPWQGVGDEPCNAFALRRSGDCLLLVCASPVEGVPQSMILSPGECSGIRLVNVLLYGEIAFLLRNGASVAIPYNAVGERKTRVLLERFLDAMFPDVDVPHNVCLSHHAEALPRNFRAAAESVMAPSESAASIAVQPAPSESTRRLGLFRRQTTSSPACALAVTTRRLILVSGERDGQATPYGSTLTMIPLKCVDSVQTEQSPDNASAVTVSFGDDRRLRLRFKDGLSVHVAETVATARNVLAALEPPTIDMTAIREISVREENVGAM